MVSPAKHAPAAKPHAPAAAPAKAAAHAPAKAPAKAGAGNAHAPAPHGGGHDAKAGAKAPAAAGHGGAADAHKGAAETKKKAPTHTGISGSSDGAAVSHGGVSGGVDADGVHVERNFEIWDTELPPISVCPGIFIQIEPSLSAQCGARVGSSERTYHGSVTGSIDVGLHGGVPKVASVYLKGGATATGKLTLVFDKHGAKSVEGRIDVDMSATVGLDIHDPIPNWDYELGSCRMFSFVGFKWEHGKVKSKGDFQLGPKPQKAFDKMNDKIKWAKHKLDQLTFWN